MSLLLRSQRMASSSHFTHTTSLRVEMS